MLFLVSCGNNMKLEDCLIKPVYYVIMWRNTTLEVNPIFLFLPDTASHITTISPFTSLKTCITVPFLPPAWLSFMSLICTMIWSSLHFTPLNSFCNSNKDLDSSVGVFLIFKSTTHFITILLFVSLLMINFPALHPALNSLFLGFGTRLKNRTELPVAYYSDPPCCYRLLG